MNDERFQKLLELDPEGVPSLAAVTKEIMRGPDVRGALVSDEVNLARPVDLYNSQDYVDPVVAGAERTRLYVDEPSAWESIVLDSCTGHPNLNEGDCRSGPNDWALEGRMRDRSGNKPKVRKWQNRAKAKAARKARRNNR